MMGPQIIYNAPGQPRSSTQPPVMDVWLVQVVIPSAIYEPDKSQSNLIIPANIVLHSLTKNSSGRNILLYLIRLGGGVGCRRLKRIQLNRGIMPQDLSILIR